MSIDEFMEFLSEFYKNSENNNDRLLYHYLYKLIEEDAQAGNHMVRFYHSLLQYSYGKPQPVNTGLSLISEFIVKECVFNSVLFKKMIIERHTLQEL